MLVSIHIHNDQSWLANYLWRILHSTSKGLTLQAVICTVRNFRGNFHFLRKYDGRYNFVKYLVGQSILIEKEIKETLEKTTQN
jgi:hypothetical protein